MEFYNWSGSTKGCLMLAFIEKLPFSISQHNLFNGIREIMEYLIMKS